MIPDPAAKAPSDCPKYRMGGQLGRKIRVPVKHRRPHLSEGAYWSQLLREAEEGVAFFWSRRGGRPPGSSFGDTFVFGKGVGA